MQTVVWERSLRVCIGKAEKDLLIRSISGTMGLTVTLVTRYIRTQIGTLSDGLSYAILIYAV